MAANNIATFRKQRGLSQTELAEKIGTTLNMMGKLERGDRSLDQAWLDKIGGALGVGAHELIAPDVTAKAISSISVLSPAADDVVHIQKLDLSLSMGPGTHIEDWVESEPVAFDLAFIQAITRTPTNRLKLVTGIGDSMYPTLNWGDVILIDTSDRQLARQDGVYWIDVYGAAGLKRLRNVGRGRVLVISDNPTVPDMEVDAADLRIQGRAIWLARGI